MARIRTVKPEFFKHYELWKAESETGLPLRVAFAGLWCVADREGRFQWVPPQIKIDVLPYDNIDFSRVLDALTTRGFVVKYRVDGRDYGYIPGFSRHQVVNNRERKSDLPQPNKNNVLTHEARDDDASPTREPRVPQGREGKGKEGGSVSSLRSDTGADAPSPDEIEVAEMAPGVAVVRGRAEAADLTDPKVQLYERGAQVLKGKSGGQITKLLRACDDSIPKARAILETASTRANPAEYVAAVIHGKAREPDSVEARTKWAI